MLQSNPWNLSKLYKGQTACTAIEGSTLTCFLPFLPLFLDSVSILLRSVDSKSTQSMAGSVPFADISALLKRYRLLISSGKECSIQCRILDTNEATARLFGI